MGKGRRRRRNKRRNQKRKEKRQMLPFHSYRKREMGPWCTPLTTVHTIIGAPTELLDDIKTALDEGLWTDFVVCAFAAQNQKTLSKYFKGKTGWVLNHIVFPINDEESKGRKEYIERVAKVHEVNVFFDSDQELVSNMGILFAPPEGLSLFFPAGSPYTLLSNAIVGLRDKYFPSEQRHKDAFEVIAIKKSEGS